MAILKKRTSSKQLPEARGLDRAPLGSVIRNFDDEPSISGGRPNLGTPSSGSSVVRPPSGGISSGTSGGAGAITSTPSTTKPAVTSGTTTKPTTTPSITTKPPLTSTTKPTTTKPAVTTKPTTTKPTITTKPTTTTKPTVTTKTSTTPTTKTTSPTSVVKPVVTKPVTKTNSTTNKVVNAVTGAVLGAGTKMIIDRITGKPTVVKDPAAGGTKQPAGSTVKPPAGSTAKPPAGSTAKPPAGGTKPPAGGAKPPITSTVLTDEEVLAELDRVKASEEAGAPPEGAVDNGDGTFSVTEDGMVTTYDANGDIVSMEAAADTTTADASTNTSGVTNDGVITRGLGSVTGDTTVADGADAIDTDAVDDTVVAGGDGIPEYYKDDEGNYYTMNADGGYDLAYYSDGSIPEDDTLLSGDGDTALADNTWTDEDTGAVWTMASDGSWDTDFNYDDYWASLDDTVLAEDNTDYNIYNDASDYTDDTVYAGNDIDYGDIDYGAKGGLITMMKKGGVPKFADGDLVYSDTEEEVQPWQNVSYNYGEEDDPTIAGYTLTGEGNPVGNTYMRSTPTALSSLVSDSAETESEWNDNGDGTYSRYEGEDYVTVDGETGTELYRTDENGEIISTGEQVQPWQNVNSSGTVGNAFYSTDELGNTVYTDNNGNQTFFDPDGNIIQTSSARPNINTGTAQRPITSAGGGNRQPVVGNVLSEGWDAVTGLGSDALSAITGALGTTAGAAGAGALIATLLGEDFTGGGTGAQNQGLDMSQVGVINPRTTDFGIGPTNFVGYDQYGTDSEGYVPNEELLRNLNAPGYNPVNEGDYGYEEVPAEESADEALPAMASGGLSSMSTPVASYYTFGQPADILANLGMRPQPPMNPPDMMPQIGQQQQQQPMQQGQQRGMPQQGMPQQMRMGGLPHVSNVPMTQGRMDFRRGSAVHGQGDGQSDDIPAMLADGEYVIDAETVAQIGNGSTKAGAQALDKFREGIRAHKRSAPINKIPPKTKALTSYLKGAR